MTVHFTIHKEHSPAPNTYILVSVRTTCAELLMSCNLLRCLPHVSDVKLKTTIICST